MASLTRQLIASGFTDLDKSQRFLAAPELEGLDVERLVGALSVAANPDMALVSLVHLWDAVPLVRRLTAEIVGTEKHDDAPRLFRALGASEALAEYALRDPSTIDAVDVGEPLGRRSAEQLRERLVGAVTGGESGPSAPAMTGVEAYRALRVAYRRELTRIAVRDVTAAEPTATFPDVSGELADLAGAALDAALVVSAAEAKEHFDAADVDGVSLAVIAMGKTGAEELNYISDVDVIYVLDEGEIDPDTAHKIGTALARGIARVISAPASEPGLWEVDPNLRPEGKDGPLVRTLDSHLAYYERWAKDWEFQALLKARAIAGDRELGARYEAAISPLIWSSSSRDGFVESVQKMRARVSDHIPEAERERQIKLGTGGLRDVEFTVQLLQLVHGRIDESLRVRNTMEALGRLSGGGYIGRDDAEQLRDSYAFLRTLEHRIQLEHMRRTHLMPAHEYQRRALSRGILGPSLGKGANAEALVAKWQEVRKKVRALHENIFYRPLLAAAANLSEDEVKLSPDAAKARLAALGFVDPAGALRHIEALTKGVSRSAAIRRQLLPAMLGYFAEGVDPDHGLLAFRRLSETLRESPWYLGMLRDSPGAAENLCRVLSTGSMIPDMLEANAEAVAWLGNSKELVPVPFESQWNEIQSKMSRHRKGENAMRLIRQIRQREILRTALADALGLLSQQEVGLALSDADRAAILGALMVAERSIAADEELVTDVLVVAMGRQGGREIGYGSDADVMYVHQPRSGADESRATEQAEKIVALVSSLLQQACKPAIVAERPLSLDLDLRPEGKNGAKVRTLESYREYYERWSDIWEAQALLRARPIAGSDELATKFVELIDPVRYPEELSKKDRLEIVRIKARVESERLPRGKDPKRHLKLGRGGLSDVEWLVQLLQLEHAHRHPELKDTSTLATLAALGELGLVSQPDAVVLRDAWLLASRLRSGTVVWTGKANDSLPDARSDLEALARWCGYPPGSAAVLEEDYLRATRQARGAFEKYFYPG